MKNILRNLNVLNLLLLIAAVVMFFAMADPLLNYDTEIKLTKVKTASEQQEEKAPVEEVQAVQDYVVVAEKNLFHPERQLTAEKKEAQPTERPEIVYYGSVITGDKKIAYIEDKKNPYSTPGRGNRQTPLAEGATIGGYTLKEVNPETIVLVNGEEKMEINLRDQKDRKPGDASFKTQSSSPRAMRMPPPLPRPGIPSGPIPPPIPARPIVNSSK